jgi:predicted nucleic acid-binding protein
LDESHVHHKIALKWFAKPGLDWGVSAFTEAGFLRFMTNPEGGRRTMEATTAVLVDLANQPGYRFWPDTEGWTTLAAPFIERMFGRHQHIIDAYLLGLAVKEGGALVTMNRTIQVLAGTELRRHVMLLE